MESDSSDRRSLEELGIIFLQGVIDGKQSEQICKAILKANTRSLEYIQLFINSPGGIIDDGFAIIDLMEWSRVPIHTTGIGTVASAALLVFMAGKKGRRVLTSRVSILSHRFFWFRWGNYSQLIAQRREEDLTHQRMLEHYRRHTNLKSDDEIHDRLLRDTDAWLSPQEAVDLGIADHVENGRTREQANGG